MLTTIRLQTRRRFGYLQKVLFKLFKSVTSRHGRLNTCLLSKCELGGNIKQKKVFMQITTGESVGGLIWRAEDRFSESIGLKQD